MPSGAGQRIVTGLLAATFVVTSNFVAPSDVWFFLSLGVFLGGMLELVGLLRKWSPGTSGPLLVALFVGEGVLMASAIRGSVAWTPAAAILAATLCVVLVPGMFALRRAEAPQDVPLILVLLGFGPLYVALPLASVYGLHVIDPWWMFLLLAITGFGDTFAWAVGSAWGRHKLAPSISPKKSWEGAIAGMAGSLASTAVFSWFFFSTLDPVLLGLAAVAAIAGQIGDLIESMFKRGVGVKDSSGVLPGHGGILDRIDAVLLAGPILYGGLTLAGYGPLP